MSHPSPPQRLELARKSTPLIALPETSRKLGVELWCKRDDLTGSALSGNKIRKLEYLLADAQERGADIVITCGGEQSNHCRATAIAARQVGLDCELFLRTADPDVPPAATGNILLDRITGAGIRWITADAYKGRGALMESHADALRQRGRRPYMIPEGGSNALGCWGYLGCAEELADDLAKLEDKATTIVYACGSGGTGAGLVLGRALTELSAQNVRIVGFNVCDDRETFIRIIGGLCRDFDQAFATGTDIDGDSIEIIDGYVGRGYARTRPEELRSLVELARDEGLILDPVYTGKAFFGLRSEMGKGRDMGERVVFLHTGGVYGLLAKHDELLGVL